MIYRVLLIASLLLPGTASLAAMLHANIVDEAGQGIPGANLVVVGSTIGTASDLEGRVPPLRLEYPSRISQQQIFSISCRVILSE